MEQADFDINDALVIKRDNLFLVASRDASVPMRGGAFGLYYKDCRFLSGWELSVFGDHPRPLVSTDARGDAATHELMARHVQVRVERELVDDRTLDERITLRSFSSDEDSGELVLRMRSGFEPLMWLRGLAGRYRPRRATAVADGNGVSASAMGRDGVGRRLVTAARPVPAAIDGQTLRWKVSLRAGRPVTVALRHVVAEDEALPRSLRPPSRSRRPARRGDAEPRARVETDSDLFDRVLERSFADLRMLRSRLDGERYYAAGIPWYATLFGRDTLITAIEMLAFDHRIAEQTLRLLAARLGTTVDPERDEEPGKVLHELRVGELANLGLLPFARYYGTVDATALFLCLLAEHADWTGNLALFHELADEVDAALTWIDRWGDRDGDGLLEYERGSPRGLENQGWKDSREGIADKRGRPLRPPIALIEAQAYTLRAKRRLARLFERAVAPDRAATLRAQAGAFAEKLERFWLEREGFYSMALDRDKRPSRALASNQGHALWSHALSPERARAVRDALMRPDMFSGWGVRTLSAAEPFYNPVGYHTGSVWPHDTALTAVGLRKYGYDEDFMRIFDGLIAAAARFADARLPELFGGFSTDDYDVPVPYPVACRPQAWAAGAIPYLLRGAMGLVPDGFEQRLVVRRPSLPTGVTHLRVHGLELAGSRIDLTFTRAGDDVTLADVQVDGDATVTLDEGAGLPSP